MGKKVQSLDDWLEGLRIGKYANYTACTRGIGHLKTNDTNKKQAKKYAEMYFKDPKSLPAKFFPNDPEPATPVRTPRTTGRKAKVEDMPSLEGAAIPVPAGGALFQQEALARLSYLREMIQTGARLLEGFKAAWDVNKELDLSELQGVVNNLGVLQAAYDVEVRRAAPFLMTPVTGAMIPPFPLPTVVPPAPASAPRLGAASVAQEAETLRSTRPPFLPPPPSH